VYSLTGLIPEKIPVKSLEQAQKLFRKYLSDEHYFGKKSFLTAYCENEFRPKFPSQNQTLSKPLMSGFEANSGKKQVGPGSNIKS